MICFLFHIGYESYDCLSDIAGLPVNTDNVQIIGGDHDHHGLGDSRINHGNLFRSNLYQSNCNQINWTCNNNNNLNYHNINDNINSKGQPVTSSSSCNFGGLSASCACNSGYYSEELHKAIESILHIANHLKEEDEEKNVSKS